MSFRFALKTLIVFVFGILCGGAIMYLLTRPHPDAFNTYVYHDLMPGMTRDEVTGMLGVMPGDYRTDTSFRTPSHAIGGTFFATEDGQWVQTSTTDVWVNNSGLIEVEFDMEGKVKSTRFRPLVPETPNPNGLPFWVRIMDAIGL